VVEPVLYLGGDESGALHDPQTAVITAVMLMTYNPAPLRWIIPRVKRQVPRKHPKPGRISEFKFYMTTDPARFSLLSNLSKAEISIVAFSLYKGRQVIEDTPENYGVLLCGLLERCVARDQTRMDIAFDNHYTNPAKRRALQSLVQIRLGLTVQFVDSQKDSLVQLADFVAGAVNYARLGRSSVFYEAIRSRIVGDELQAWKEARRHWLETRK